MSVDLIKRRDRAGGFTLFEVLIAVLILSIGLLGVAGLQLYGLRYNQGSMLRSQATMAAYDIMDRMRANAEEAYVDPGDNSRYDDTDTDSPPADPGCSGAGGCTPTQLADHDIAQWANLVSALPGGRGTIQMMDSVGGRYRVTVSWTENEGRWAEGEDGGPVAQEVAMNVLIVP